MVFSKENTVICVPAKKKSSAKLTAFVKRTIELHITKKGVEDFSPRPFLISYKVGSLVSLYKALLSFLFRFQEKNRKNFFLYLGNPSVLCYPNSS